MKLSLLTSHASVCDSTMVGFESGDTVDKRLNSSAMHRHTGPAPGIMIWGGIGYHSRTPLVRIAGTLKSQRYISEITTPAATPDQLWQRVEAACSAVPQEYTQSLFESMPRRVAVVISNNGGYSGY
ncbi:transposable element Tcb1 transposase [Trichonephila clavipes]|uniref:Transposable element Tcb1 transposase n=1 Tax=Trichonephila clavipes TaxID=2585209 RepID=A0A8X6RNA2_TRICX|nr:transposable element Tcb1 transposase [Trichonephila clavipes]